MEANQITNIAFKIGEIGARVSISFWVAIISAVASISAALLAGFFAWKLNEANKHHIKQWAYVSKVSLLIDNAIEIFSRMLYNKLLISYFNDVKASENLFLLQKDILVIESQMAVYGSLEIVESIYNFKNLIVQTPKNDFVNKWGEIYEEGRKYLLLCRKELGNKISEDFKEFTNKLTKVPPKDPNVLAAVSRIGELNKVG